MSGAGRRVSSRAFLCQHSLHLSAGRRCRNFARRVPGFCAVTDRYVLGGMGRSFVVAYGVNPSRHPHRQHLASHQVLPATQHPKGGGAKAVRGEGKLLALHARQLSTTAEWDACVLGAGGIFKHALVHSKSQALHVDQHERSLRQHAAP